MVHVGDTKAQPVLVEVRIEPKLWSIHKNERRETSSTLKDGQSDGGGVGIQANLTGF